MAMVIDREGAVDSWLRPQTAGVRTYYGART